MRLTLRTLLAWLDGVLSPEEQVQLGEKVSASQTASLLAERIRVAVNRPAIAAPAPDARGLADEANSVADFLDNTLSADQLAAFERICLESDMHLAEVAACHSMLATLARQPSPAVALATRQRLQALVHERLERERFGAASGDPQASGDGHQESRETARALRAALGAADVEADAVGGRVHADPGHASPADVIRVDATPTAAGQSASGGARRPRSTPAAWWSAIVAASLLLALVGILGWQALRGSGPRKERPQGARAQADGGEPAAAQPDAAVAAVTPAAPAGLDDPAMPAAAAVADTAANPNQAVVTPREEPAAAGPAQPQSGQTAVQKQAALEKTAPEKTDTPQPAAEAVAAASMPAGGGPRPEPAAAPEPPGAAGAITTAARPAPATPAAAIEVVSGPLLRLVKQPAGQEWQHAAAGTSVPAGEELLVPPWSEAKLRVGGVDVSLLALTDAAFLVDRDAAPRLDMLFGRCLIGGAQAGRIGVTAGGLSGVIAAGPATLVAVDVGLDRSGSGEVAAPVAAGSGSITAGQRPFVWQPTAADGTVAAAEPPLEVPAGESVVWQNGRAALTAAVSPSRLDASGLPDRLQKVASETLGARISAGKPLLLALREMTSDRRVENRMLAAATLALIGQADALVELLEAAPGNRSYLEDQQWSTLERMAVPATLARGGEATAGLHQSFIKHAPPEHVDRLWAMARGLTAADLAGGGERMLLDSLDDQSLMVRRYAYKTLCDIVRPSPSDRLRYRPDALPERRRDGITWWRGQLQQGLVRP